MPGGLPGSSVAVDSHVDGHLDRQIDEAGDGSDTMSATLASAIKTHAHTLGFDLVGITSLGTVGTAERFDTWIAAGYAGDMTYLPNGADKRHDTRRPFEGAHTAIVVAMNYGGTQPAGPIARYARGDDYHDVMRDKLDALLDWLRAQIPHEVIGKSYVDTGPILERDLARKAGLGWFGKNTNLINPKLGSFFFLGALLVDLVLEHDEPFELDRCGTCTRCLDACPTNAFVEPHVLDATQCISYLTIERRGPIPEALREPMGELIYGCDICQEVCPWNVRFARAATEPTFAAREGLLAPDLPTLLTQRQEDFSTRFRKSPIKRTKRHGLARNVAVAMGNRGDRRDLPALRDAAANDPDDVVRSHAQWAIEQIERRHGISGRVAPSDTSSETPSKTP